VSEASPSTIDIMLALHAMQIVAEGGLQPWVHTSAGWFVLDGARDLVADEALRSGMEPVIVSTFTEEHLMHAVMITGASDDEAALEACEAQAQAALGGAAVVSRARPHRLDITQVRA
jgi:hypothetical protein